MSLFNKKKKKGVRQKKKDLNNFSGLTQSSELPELPELPDFNDNFNEHVVDDVSSEIPPLPSFPESSVSENLSQEVVKDAVSLPEPPKSIQQQNTMDDFGIPSKPLHSQSARTLEMSSHTMQPSVSSRSMRTTMPISMPGSEIYHVHKSTHSTEPVFIRIDKFQNALNAFNEIKLRVGEIEDLLKDIRLVREKEEAELVEWEREIETIKARIQKIDNEIFGKV